MYEYSKNKHSKRLTPKLLTVQLEIFQLYGDINSCTHNHSVLHCVHNKLYSIQHFIIKHMLNWVTFVKQGVNVCVLNTFKYSLG